MENILTSAYFNLLMKLIFFLCIIESSFFVVCLRHIRMKSRSTRIRMVEKSFDYKDRNVCPISVYFHLLLIPFSIFIFMELNLGPSQLYYFLQEVVLLVVMSFHDSSRVNS